MNTQNSESKTESPQWYWEMLKAIAAFFSIIILVFTRRNIGVRMLNISRMVGITLGLSLGSLFLEPFARPFVPGIAIFALAALALGIYQNLRRWAEMSHGQFTHTFSSGTSWLEKLPWPNWCLAHRRLYRVWEPALVAIVGCILGVFSHLLGFVVVMGAAFEMIFEDACYRIRINMDLSVIDSFLEVEMQQKVVEFYQSGDSTAIAPSLDETAGIVIAGISPDIKLQIENRKNRKVKLPQSNLVNA